MRRVITQPAFLFFACLVGFELVQRAMPVTAGYSFEMGMAAGGGILIVAAMIGGWAIAEMSRHKTAVSPNERPSHLVTSGPFRFSRNPLYVALVLVLLAIAIMTNSLWIALGAVLLFVLLDRFVVRREETLIAEAFGAEFASYRFRVRRWL